MGKQAPTEQALFARLQRQLIPQGQQWLRTPAAAVALDCSQNHLQRCRDSHGGFLVGGEHYILGSSHSAAILWNVDAIRAAFHYRGMLRQRGEAALQQTVGA